MDPVDRQRLYYAQTAHAYDSMHVEEDHEHDRALALVSGFINSLGASSLLDIGTGTGRVLRYLREHHPDVDVHGVDPVPELLEIAISEHAIPRENVTVASGNKLPFPDDSFDYVTEFAVLHHVPDPRVVVEEMKRVARKGVFLSDNNRFGQGGRVSGIAKLLLYRAGLWGILNRMRHRGSAYYVSDGDGVAYSYSVYDSLSQFDGWAAHVQLLGTSATQGRSTWLRPLLTSQSVLLCAFRPAIAGVDSRSPESC